MTAPTYFDEKKIAVATCGNLTDLTDMIFYGKMTLVGCLPTKGGRCDYNGGISDSQGGGNRTESLCRNGQTYVPPRGAARSQGQWSVAHIQRSVRGAETAGTVRAVSGKLNSSSVAHLRPVVSQAPSRRRCSRYLTDIIFVLMYSLQDFPSQQCVSVRRRWEGLPMTTTSTRIHLFNADGQEVGNISASTLSALIDSGLLDRKSTPVENLAPIHGPCIECGTHPRRVGIFCRCCFERLQACDAAWAATWYGLDWDEAVQQAEREVSNAAD